MKTVQHAIFGDCGGRHALLAASVERDATTEAIRALSDLAPDRPAHVEWTPYVTGVRVQDQFVVMRTVPDSAASRPGMVLTHAAFAPVSQVVGMDDIGRLVAALPGTPVRMPVVSGSSLPEAPRTEPLPASVHADLIGAVIAAAPRGRVGWIGDRWFDEAVRAVWRIMTVDERTDFSFGFAFNPRSTPTGVSCGVSLVRTPRRLRDRWSGGLVVDPENPSGSAPSPVAAALVGHPGGEGVSKLLDVLGWPTLALSLYEALGRAAEYHDLIRRDTASLMAIRTFAQLVGRLAPEPSTGSELKLVLTARLGSETEQGEDLLGLRNFDPAPYADGHRVFSAAAQTWARAALTDPEGRTDDAAVVTAAIMAAKGSPWGKAVVNALAAELGSWRQEYSDAVWTWWQYSEACIEPTLRLVRPPKRAEQDLVAGAPKGIPNAAAVERHAAEQGFLVLFAHVVAARKPSHVFAALAEMDPSGKCLEAWDHAASCLGPSNTVTAAAEADSAPEVLLRLASRVAAKIPEVFQDLDATQVGWRNIWAGAVGNGMSVFDKIKFPARQRDALLDTEVADEAAHALLIAIADTEAADLLDHPKRSQVWARLPADARDAYLRATATSWTQRLRSGENLDWTFEPPLERAVFDPAFNPGLFDPHQPESVPLTAEAFGRTSILSERAFIDWIGEVARGPRLSAPDAALVGSLVAKRGWTDAARTIVKKAEKNRTDFWQAVGQFVQYLGLLDRALFALKSGSYTLPEDDWWTLLEDVAADLLTTASSLEYVWESAGGKVGDLRSAGTGKQLVHHALRLVRGGNRVTTARLLEVLRREYKFNSRLDLISNIGRQVGILPRTH